MTVSFCTRAGTAWRDSRKSAFDSPAKIASPQVETVVPFKSFTTWLCCCCCCWSSCFFWSREQGSTSSCWTIGRLYIRKPLAGLLKMHVLGQWPNIPDLGGVKLVRMPWQNQLIQVYVYDAISPMTCKTSILSWKALVRHSYIDLHPLVKMGTSLLYVTNLFNQIQSRAPSGLFLTSHLADCVLQFPVSLPNNSKILLSI